MLQKTLIVVIEQMKQINQEHQKWDQNPKRGAPHPSLYIEASPRAMD